MLCCTGLPVQVRDKMADVKDNLPQSDVNKEFYRQNLEGQVCVCLLMRAHACVYMSVFAYACASVCVVECERVHILQSGLPLYTCTYTRTYTHCGDTPVKHARPIQPLGHLPSQAQAPGGRVVVVR